MWFKLVKTEQNYQALYMMMYVSFIVEGNIKFAIKALLCTIQYFDIVDTIK
jgi:hypothetical protein